ncbi:MAG: Rrf2 family transcriptional regulator [Acidobacteria bacterium]|nr:Rrf2 family transcriptional regulator [Acidobacteriota bacterium]
MLFSRSAEYAIRAFLYLAKQEPGKLVMAKRIADRTDLPSHFLAKLLQQLARRGLVRSNKGPSGGFTLGRPAREITLYDIVAAVDGVQNLERCPAGESKCTDQASCELHVGWKPVRSRIIDYLEHTTLAEAVKPGTARSQAKKRKAGKR